MDSYRAEHQTTKSEFSKETFRRYGQKSARPFFHLLDKYEHEIVPLLNSISEGLRSGAQSLESSDGEKSNLENKQVSANKLVASWFTEGHRWFDHMAKKIASSHIEDTIEYVEKETKDNPVFTFASSYFLGMLVGRVGKHMRSPESIEKFKENVTLH